MMTPFLLTLRRTSFVLWRPRNTDVPPSLVIGRFQDGNPRTLVDRRMFSLAADPSTPDLWTVPVASCGLSDGQVYHYWFEVTDSNPRRNGSRILCTDPFASTVDWRLKADRLPDPYTDDDRDPAAVILFRGGELVPCDAAGELIPIPPRLADGPANNRIVIYELPTSWTSINVAADPQLAVGSFRDVLALVQAHAAAPGFPNVAALAPGRSHLQELGINALELLPPADSFVDREWGYATSNYFAPDYDLGLPAGATSPTANVDLAALVTACHQHGIRFFADVVMAFATHAPLENVNYPEFHLDPAAARPDDPDAQQSGNQGTRYAFGGELWRYGTLVPLTDPVTGAAATMSPARRYLQTFAARWLADFGVDGIRMDSVNNVANWDFVQEFKDFARSEWAESGGTDDRFLVVGEELSVPLELITQQRLDGLWNPNFAYRVRALLLGELESGFTFAETVRRIVDCRSVGFTDGTQTVNYLGSHDVEGYRNERLYNFLDDNGVASKEERIKLAFVCLLTAAGVPMMLAGDEFADEHDLRTVHPDKQRDAVNYERLEDAWRRRVFDHVSRLVKLRTGYDALGNNDTELIHVDTDGEKRIAVWRRGLAGSDNQVVVVANFSGFTNVGEPGAEYVVPGWPALPAGARWREVTQQRDVPPEWAGREPLAAWEAKVYAAVPA